MWLTVIILGFFPFRDLETINCGKEKLPKGKKKIKIKQKNKTTKTNAEF